jgi:8-oxo-dGTP pyrophosphatase MutT (NUDIX family)
MMREQGVTDWPTRLARVLDPLDKAQMPTRSDYDLNVDMVRVTPDKPAAVLVPLILRDSGWQVLLTRRTQDMPTHAGQIAFPGGRAGKHEALHDTALREFEEETGIARSRARLLGRFERYETASGYAIAPFVAVLQGPVRPKPDPREVEEVFEVPFAFLMDDQNHQRQCRQWQGTKRYYYAMPWKDYFIWGATAGMLRALALRLGAELQKECDL